MYRPEGWKNDSYDCSVCDTEPEGCPGCGSSAYEAGADAMLERLKKQGYYRAKATYIDSPPLMAYLKAEGKQGWLVFISEEEE